MRRSSAVEGPYQLETVEAASGNSPLPEGSNGEQLGEDKD